MGRVKLRGVPTQGERQQALQRRGADVLNGKAPPHPPFGGGTSAKDAKRIIDDIRAGNFLSPLPIGVGNSEAEVSLLVRLRMDAAAMTDRERRRGRPYDPWTLIRAAEVIFTANAPLEDSPGSRAVALVMSELGFARERARSTVSRLIAHMRSLEQDAQRSSK